MSEGMWLIIGFTGQLLFGLRFLIQWICSEIKQESHIPIIFWYFSISGGAILLIYAIQRKDPVFIVGQSTGLLVYLRNLRLIYKKEKNGKDGKI
ncbi:MAG: lipid-A-disaccharide synthase N-terminal domain-containing protein [Candidatus Omnitrophica bacterium]|nr:lipid-A-disaccharide synthase N-terminal domain-containing protein [Candidatus Omnitrophota bacterium]